LACLDQKNRDYWFLTVTVKNWLTLTKEGLSGMVAQLAELRETELWKEQITGGVYSLEATYNRNGGTWHPHFHILIETKKALPKIWVHRLKKAWLRITGDSEVINPSPVYGRDDKGRKTKQIDLKSVRELVKYATKAANFCELPEQVVEFYHAFRNVRKVQAFGTFLGAMKEAARQLEEEEGKPTDKIGCKCGMCTWADGELVGTVHINETRLMADGTRQMKWSFWDDLPPPLPPVLVSEFTQAQLEAMEERRLLAMQPSLSFGGCVYV